MQEKISRGVFIRVVNESFVKDWLDHVAKRVMYDAVTKLGLADFSRFWISYDERLQRRWTIAVQKQFCSQCRKILCKIRFEFFHILLFDLAFSCS